MAEHANGKWSGKAVPCHLCGLCVRERKLLFISFGSGRKETVNVVEFPTVIFQNFYQIEN